ncbi:uncharacterized protein LOC144921886 isoform X1 [Branchiostoma floridae x Branchiostoma belcheri]
MKRKIAESTPEAAETRRDWKRAKMQEYRSNETPGATAIRLAAKRTHMRQKRKEETPQDTEKRLAAKRTHMKQKRKEETPQDTEKRLAAKRTHMKQKRKEETPQDTEKRLAAKRTHMKQKRKEETPQDTEKRLAAVRTHMMKRKKEETPQATEQRLVAKRTHMQKRRKEETPQATEQRLAAKRTHMQKRRKEETPQATEKRLAAKRTHMQHKRTQETQQIREKRLKAQRTHKQKRRETETPQETNRRLAAVRTSMTKRRKLSKNNETSIDQCGTIFCSKIEEGPIYVCVSCLRLLYKCTVLGFKAGNYTPNEVTEKVLTSGNGIKTNGKSWICRTCHESLKKGNVPTQSWANDMALDAIPEELKDLRPLEVRLISQRIAFMKMVGLPRGGQKAIQGSAVNVPSKLQPVISLLPRLPETAEVVPLKLKRKLCYKGHHMYEYIRPHCVMKGLQWLQQNNPLYNDISICEDWEDKWKDNEGDLWEAMTTAVPERDIEQEENTNSGLSVCPVSPTPSPPNYYETLQQLAQRRNLKIRDVPGDGNCFFHAMSWCLHTAGLQQVSGPELRTKLIEYFETTEHVESYFGFHSIPNIIGTSGEENSTPQQHQQFQVYLDGLRSGEWADHLAVQGAADMLNVNIEITKTSSTDWTTEICPKQGRSENTVTIGLMGELHYVALEKADTEPTQETRHEMEDEEDRIAFEQTSKVQGVPYDTLLQHEQVIDDSDRTYSVAPGENQQPCPFFSDKHFEVLANPEKYPFGKGGFSEERSKHITPRKFFNQRLLHVDGRFAKDIDYLFAAQYAVEAKQMKDSIQIFLRQTRGHTFQGQTVNAGLMKNLNNINDMLRTDTAIKFMKNIRGSPPYWNNVLLELLAMVRQLGLPTFFLTLSAADMQWPEVIGSIARQYGKFLTADDVKNMNYEEKCSWLRRNPVTAARQFSYRLNAFFKEFIGGKGKPIGHLQDYLIRIEFQARGAPHAHSILWIKDAPKVDLDSDEVVTNFISEHQTCAIPEEDDDLRNLVLSLQKHNHSFTCKQGQSCRFRYPRPPSRETLIARQNTHADVANIEKELKIKSDTLQQVRTVLEAHSDEEDLSLGNLLLEAQVDPDFYHKVLKIVRSGKEVVLQRKISERFINSYNPHILRVWKANMDIQYILDVYACIMYITSYMLKSERSMSELLKKVAVESKGEDVKERLRKLGSTFLNNREVSAQEAAFRVLSMPLKKASRQVVFVNSAAKEKRVSILKPKNILQDMTDEDTNIFCTSLIDRYVSRPLVLEDMCLVEFAATYTVAKKSRSEENDTDVPYEEENCGEDGITGSEYGSIPDRYPDVIRLCNGLGNMRKRRRHCIVRFHKEKKDDEERYRNLLMLYLPWRNEDVDLKGAFNCFKDHYESAKDIVHVNESKFSINAVRIEEACDDLQRMGPMDDMWNDVSPNVQFLQSEQLNEGVVQERDLPVEDGCENIDLAANEMSNNHSELHARYTSELNKGLMTPEEYRCMMRSLNKKQFEVVMYHRRWCKDVISALKQKQNIPQYMLFLSGPGGVGKSHVIKLIRYLTMSLLIPHSGQYFQPNELPLLLTAFTGTAAFGIQGMTLHSALGFACGPRKDNEYLPPSCEKLQALRSHLGKLKLLVIDEMSMVGADLLYHIHRRLQDISDQSTPESIFGGVSILAVGDLFQLQPVGQSHVFSLPSDSYARLYGSLWQENFEMMELTENMRQRDDQDFAALLQRVRTGDCTTQDMDLLRTRVIHKDDTNYPVNALHIFKTNKDVDEHNEQQLLTLGAQVYNIRAIDRKKDLGTGLVDIVFSSKPSDTGGLRELVSVAVGARVMVTLNIDVSDGLSNGVFGTVAGIDNAGKDVRTIMVRFDNENVGRQAVANSQFKRSFPGVVPITRQTVHFYTGRGRRSVQAERSQFPLSLAWGCTIHKVQGKTLDKVVMGMQGRGRFMPGQAYVGLSRVKTLSSLYLLGFDPNAIRVNPAVKDEMTRLRQNPESRQQMTNLNRDCSAAENSYLPLAQPSATTAHCTSLNIKFLNIRSYTQHLPDLKADSTLQPAEVFCYVETFLYPNQEVELFPPNSIAVRADRKGRGGGVMTVASKNISPKQLHIQLDELEYTAITVTKLSTNVNIINIYRPQTMPEGLFISMLHRLIDQLPHDTMTVILGDFNFNILDCPQPKILAVMQQYGFTQEVQTPTTDYGTLLDHVYIRDQEQHGRHVTVMDTYFSDHDLVTVTITP